MTDLILRRQGSDVIFWMQFVCFCVYAHLVCNVEQCRWGSGPEIGEVPESSRFSYFWDKVKSLLQNLCNWPLQGLQFFRGMIRLLKNWAHKHHILISGIKQPGLGDHRGLEDEQKGLILAFIEYDQTQKVH